jgi:hypothetical protein
MLDLSALKKQILGLSVADRDQLKNLLDYEEARAPVRTTRDEEEVWRILTRLTPRGVLMPRYGLGDFLRDRRHGVGRVEFAEGVRQLAAFAAEAAPVRHQAQDRVALLEIGLDCLAGDLAARGVEINPKTLLLALPRLRVAVDHCYPGYVEAGMLHKLIRVAATE